MYRVAVYLMVGIGVTAELVHRNPDLGLERWALALVWPLMMARWMTQVFFLLLGASAGF